MTPDLLLDQGPSGEMSSEEEQVMQTIYSILRQGYGPPSYRGRAEISAFHSSLYARSPVFSGCLLLLRTNESDVVIKHKVKVIFQKIQNLKVGHKHM